MNVTFVSINALPLFKKEYKGIFGGAEVQTKRIAEAISDHFHVSIIVENRGQGIIQERKLKLIPSFSQESTFINYLRAPFHFFKALKEAKPEVLLQRTHSLETTLCAIYGLIKNVPFIYMVANESDLNGVYFRGWRGHIFKWGVLHASLLVTQNKEHEALAKKLGKNYITIKKIVPVHQQKTGRTILWVGRCEPVKRPELFIWLAKKNQENQFVMICPKSRDEELFKKISREAKRLSNLQFIPGVPHEEIDFYFKESKLFIYTSLFDGDLPLTCLEAMSWGTPLISFDYDPDKIITRHRIGFVADGRKEQFQKLFKKALDKKELSKLSKNSYTYLKRYHSEQNKESWIKLLESIAKRNKHE